MNCTSSTGVIMCSLKTISGYLQFHTNKPGLKTQSAEEKELLFKREILILPLCRRIVPEMHWRSTARVAQCVYRHVLFPSLSTKTCIASISINT